MELIDEILNPNQLKGRDTGYTDLDAITGGLRSGALCVLAGATGMGKSLLALNIISRMTKQGVRCFYMDLENGYATSQRRLLKIHFGVDDVFLSNESNRGEIEQMLLELSSINYLDHEGLSVKGKSMLASILGFMQATRMTTDLYLIDPLQVIESSLSSNQLYQEQGNIIKILKEFAQKYDKTVIVCHHIRKSTAGGGNWVEDVDDVGDVKYRVPTLDDLRGSGKISDFATDVWALVRSMSNATEEGRSRTLVRVLKNRNGNLGDIKLRFSAKDLTFKERVPFAIDIMPQMNLDNL